MRRYQYLGHGEVDPSADSTARTLVRTAADVRHWTGDSGQNLGRAGEVTATFVVDAVGDLWIADRHSEHVHCARGGEVRTAGEMSFTLAGGGVTVVAATNQSTGYCPEPDSWPAAAEALERAGIAHPPSFTNAFDFRLCDGCGMRNIVKDGWFVCAVCGEELDRAWNMANAAVWNEPLLETSS